MKKYRNLFWILAVLALCFGCGAEKDSPGELRELEFTVVAEENIPETLREIIEEQKKEPFKVTYSDGGWLYIAEGYGVQNGGGYSIRVNDFYETENALYTDTSLYGPQETETAGEGKSFPYIVLKTEDIGKNVVFR